MKLLLYCTKAKPYLVERLPFNEKKFYQCRKKNDYYSLNGKIVAECDFEVEEITIFTDYTGWNEMYETKKVDYTDLLMKSCLDDKQLDDYLYGENGYAIHIKNLHIFDKPRFIQDYSKNENPYNYIESAPQNMMYAYDVKSFNNFEKKVLISIQPQWLCKILNGEKTIEVRKRVLKEML